MTPLTIGIILRDKVTQLGTNGLDFPHFNTKTINTSLPLVGHRGAQRPFH